MQDAGPLRASIHFPVEGQSSWLLILRVVALGSLVSLALVAVMMAMDDDWRGSMPVMMAGLGVFCLLEYIVIRMVVVPRSVGYGRFRLYQHKVDFYPLAPAGLTVSERRESEPVTVFTGVTVREAADKSVYTVVLTHKNKARSLYLKRYNAPQPALAHAESLAQALGVSYAPSKSVLRRAA